MIIHGVFWKTKYKAFELCLFERYGFNWKRNFALIDFSSNVRLQGDHSPGFNFIFILLNFKIIEIELYDTRHEELIVVE